VNIDPAEYVRAVRKFITGYDMEPANTDRKDKLAA
jgi:hypothetical protein